MANRVTYSNVFSQTWQNIYDILNSTSNVADPLKISGRKFVYTREPDVKNINFGTFPYIIVHPTGVQKPAIKKLDMKGAKRGFSCEIEVVACDRGNGPADAQGNATCNALSDTVMQVLQDVTIRKALQANGLFNITVDAFGFVPEDAFSTKVYRRSILLTGDMFQKVSA